MSNQDQNGQEMNKETYDEVADKIDAFDFNRAVALMSVMEKVAAVAPKATAISGLAQAALEEMNNEAKAIARERAEAAQAKQAEREAEEAAERKRQLDAEEAAKPRAIPSSTFDPDVKPPRESETDKIAKDNMRRV